MRRLVEALVEPFNCLAKSAQLVSRIRIEPTNNCACQARLWQTRECDSKKEEEEEEGESHEATVGLARFNQAAIQVDSCDVLANWRRKCN